MKKYFWIITAIISMVTISVITYGYRRWERTTEQQILQRSQVVQTRSGAIEYAKLGNGPAVLVLHGLKGGYDQGIVTARLLRGSGFEFFSVSRPGYLRTPLDTGQTPEKQADALAALLDALGIQSAAVVAQSIGGPYALQFALRHPERCWGVVLISAVTMPAEEQHPTTLDQFLSLLVDSDFGNWLMLSMVEKWPERMIPLLITNPEHLEMVLRDPVKEDSILQAAQSLALSSHRKTGSQNDIDQITHMAEIPVEEITTPILVIAGTGDDLTKDAENLGARNPSVQSILVKGGDHSTFTVFSDQLVPQVIQFLNKNVPPP